MGSDPNREVILYAQTWTSNGSNTPPPKDAPWVPMIDFWTAQRLAWERLQRDGW